MKKRKIIKLEINNEIPAICFSFADFFVAVVVIAKNGHGLNYSLCMDGVNNLNVLSCKPFILLHMYETFKFVRDRHMQVCRILIKRNAHRQTRTQTQTHAGRYSNTFDLYHF